MKLLIEPIVRDVQHRRTPPCMGDLQRLALLVFLVDRLDHHEQTTHATPPLPRTLEDVFKALAELWRDPRAYTVSTASQVIRQFLKQHQQPGEAAAAREKTDGSRPRRPPL